MVGVRARRKAERPREILEAAFEEFVLKGYAATRLEDVAKRLAITKGTIYFYFGSKEQVFELAVHTIGSLPLAAFNSDQPAWTDDIVEDLRVYLTNLYRFIDDNPRSRETLRLLVAEAHRFPDTVVRYFAAFMDPVVNRLQARLAEAAARDEIRRDLPYIAEVMASPPFGYMVMSLLFVDNHGIAADQLFQSQFKLLFGGLFLPDAKKIKHDSRRGAGWSEWLPAPDALKGELLTAPLGPGVYELRLTSGERLLFGIARNVAALLAKVLPIEVVEEAAGSRSRRQFLMRHLADLEYRTHACPTFAAAQELAEGIDQRPYRFKSGPPSGASSVGS